MEFEFTSRKDVRDSQIHCSLTFFGSFAIWESDKSYGPHTQKDIHRNTETKICLVLRGFLDPLHIKDCYNLQLPFYKWVSYLSWKHPYEEAE